MTGAQMKLTSGFWVHGQISAVDSAVTPSRQTLQKYDQRQWATGTGSGQVDLVAVAHLSIPTSTFVEIDLYGGLILDAAGATVSTLYELPGGAAATFQTLRAFQAQVVSGATGVRVGGAATNPHGLWFDAASRTWDIEYGGPPRSGGGPAGKTCTTLIRRVRFLNLSASVVASVRVAVGGVKQ